MIGRIEATNRFSQTMTFNTSRIGCHIFHVSCELECGCDLAGELYASVSRQHLFVERGAYNCRTWNNIVVRATIVDLFHTLARLTFILVITYGNSHVCCIARVGGLECPGDPRGRRRLLGTSTRDADLGAADVKLRVLRKSLNIAQDVPAWVDSNDYLTCGGDPGLWMPSCWMRSRYSPSGMHVGILCV